MSQGKLHYYIYGKQICACNCVSEESHEIKVPKKVAEALI